MNFDERSEAHLGLNFATVENLVTVVLVFGVGLCKVSEVRL